MKESEMKCIICNYMYIWWEISFLSFTYTALTDAQGPKKEKCIYSNFIFKYVLFYIFVVLLH